MLLLDTKEEISRASLDTGGTASAWVVALLRIPILLRKLRFVFFPGKEKKKSLDNIDAQVSTYGTILKIPTIKVLCN